VTYTITLHAVDRAIQRLPACRGMDFQRAHEWLARQLATARPYGIEKAGGRGLLIDGGIAVVDEAGSVVTVMLDPEQHRNNLRARKRERHQEKLRRQRMQKHLTGEST
jgi:hypothetical protein